MAEVPIGIKLVTERLDGKHTAYTLILPQEYADKLNAVIVKLDAVLNKYLAPPLP